VKSPKQKSPYGGSHIEARKYGRYGHRDATMILVAYRHGLRASEVCDLQWQQIELSEGRLHVHRVKNGISSVHPIRGDEMRGLRKLRRDYPTDAHVFVSERGGPIGPIGFHPHPAHRGGRIQQRRSLVRTVRLKQDLLREPNHHERKSNQKEEARGCTVVFPVSHFRPLSHFRSVDRLVARSRRSIRLSGNTSMPETEPKMILPLCERSCELFRCAP
jgi:hypothetical protein